MQAASVRKACPGPAGGGTGGRNPLFFPPYRPAPAVVSGQLRPRAGRSVTATDDRSGAARAPG